MIDVHETPAVPAFDPGGDERVGWYIAGALLLIVGWGFAVVVNVLAHLLAPAGGKALGPVRVFSHWGLYSEVTLGIGLFAGVVGVGLIWLAYRAPAGRLVLPGFPY